MPRVRLHPEQRAALADAATLRPSAETVWSRQQEADERELQRNLFGARELELAAAQRLREIREVATGGRGFDSERAMADADRAIDETRMSFVRDAPNATIREMLADLFDQRARVLRHELGAHVEREKFQAQIDISMQRQALAEQDAVAARTPLTFGTNIRTAFDEIDRQAALTAQPAESVAALKTRALSSAHLGRFKRLIDGGDPAAAVTYCAEHAGEMSSLDIGRARELIGTASALSSESATGEADGASADNGALRRIVHDALPWPLGPERSASSSLMVDAAVHAADSPAPVQAAGSAGSAQARNKGRKPSLAASGTGPTDADVQAAKALLSRRFVPRTGWGARAPNLLTMKRQAKKYDTITLHHTGNHDTPQEVEALHRGDEDGFLTWLGLKPPYGWSDVGYHFMISTDGKVYQGRLLEYEGAHVGKYNAGNIGIAMLGDHTNEPLTEEQLKSLKALVTMLSRHGDIKHIKTHGEFDQVKKLELHGAYEQIRPMLKP